VAFMNIHLLMLVQCVNSSRAKLNVRVGWETPSSIENHKACLDTVVRI
jgi:hypothetical protein